MSNLRNLKGLCLHRNAFKEVPESVWGCESLEELYLDGNKVASIGEGLGKLTAIRGEDPLPSDHVHSTTHLSPLPRSTELGLQDNEIASLPSTIGALKSLHTLHLEQNKLTEIPKQFGKLRSLRRLYMQNNELSKLHACVGRCEKLEIVNVENNKIEKMAKRIKVRRREP